MQKIILSICIPTYNRASYLRDSLESIYVQVSESASLIDCVEVVIADNASTDMTEVVVKEFSDKFKYFVSVRNKTNLGFDRNVDIVVRAAHGKYCWYLGDDDVIINGALSHIVNTLQTDAYSVISVTDKPLIKRQGPFYKPEIYTSADHICGLTPSQNYLKGYLPSALSMLIFDCAAWLEEANFTDHTPGWYYFETILKIAANPSARILHITKPMVQTGQDMRWADGGAGLKIFIDCNRFLHQMIAWGYNKDEIGREIASNTKKIPYVLLQAKVRGFSVTKNNFDHMRQLILQAPFFIRLLSYALFFLPNTLVGIIHKVKKSL